MIYLSLWLVNDSIKLTPFGAKLNKIGVGTRY